VKFTLFSMMVSASIFASFNITTFYTTIVIVAGSSIRPLLMFGSWTGFVYETTHPDAIIKLIEACYMKRHEEDLIGEEETYRML
jgi:predicted DNA-binding transcriptional regulator